MNSEKLKMNNEELSVGACIARPPRKNQNEIRTKTQRGITLIALIITIIIMLILAGVVLSLTIGERGIFKTAKDAGEKYEIAEIKEQIQTEIIDEQANNMGNISNNKLEEILLKYGSLTNEENILDRTLTTSKGAHKIKVIEIFNGKSVEKAQLKPYVLPETIGGANSPDISGFKVENTHYVTWGTAAPYQINELNETNTIDKAPPTEWSDYAGKRWANIVTSGGGNECYWVWIPRYAYKIMSGENTNVAGTIDIVFLKGKTNKDMNGNDVTLSSYINSKGQTGAYKVHPAFTQSGNGGFGELTGIWVAKFEASSSSVSEINLNNGTLQGDTASLSGTGGGDVTNLQVRVKPNVTSWRGITVNNIFEVCQNMTQTGNSLAETTGLDSHMMKNTEWGAVAYLSRSIYGLNDEVWNNPYYNNTTNNSPITGLCSNKTNGNNEGTMDITETCRYNEAGGGNASTTGNVYGIYDMAGGAGEYVAGIYKGTSSDNLGNNTDRNKLWISNNLRYVDQYIETTGTQKTYYGNTNKYGDAVYETSSSGFNYDGCWNSSFAFFPWPDGPVFARGGFAINDIPGDIFAFFNNSGGAFNDHTFRPVVISL